MKFMVILKANASSEAGLMPSAELIADMQGFNEGLVKAGTLLDAEGLHPSSKGARILIDGDRRSVVDGPFGEPRELVAGFWLIQAGSREEAVEAMRRCPHPFGSGSAEIEIRQMFSPDDFGAEFTPELREREQGMRAQVDAG